MLHWNNLNQIKITDISMATVKPIIKNQYVSRYLGKTPFNLVQNHNILKRES